MPDPGSSGSSVSSQSSDDESSAAVPSSHPALHPASGSGPLRSMSYLGDSRPRPPLRKGKWSAEEEAYVSQIISDFNKGLLPLPAGTTLRGYLSEKLNCDPMRITKKFAGAACIGKRIFQPCEHSVGTAAEIERAQKNLAELETRFLETLVERRRPPQHLQTPANFHRTPPLVRPDVFRDFLVGNPSPKDPHQLQHQLQHPHAHLGPMAHHAYMPHPGMLFHHHQQAGMLPQHQAYHRPDLMYPQPYDDRGYRPPTPASRYAVHPPSHYARPPPHQGPTLNPHAYPHRPLSAYPPQPFLSYMHMPEDGMMGCHGGGAMEHLEMQVDMDRVQEARQQQQRQRHREEGDSLAAALYDDKEGRRGREEGEGEGARSGEEDRSSCDSEGDGPCQCRSPNKPREAGVGHTHTQEGGRRKREREMGEGEEGRRENEAAALLPHHPNPVRPKSEPATLLHSSSSSSLKAEGMGKGGGGGGMGMRRSNSSTASLSALAGLSAREPVRCLTQKAPPVASVTTYEAMSEKHGQDTQAPGSSPHGGAPSPSPSPRHPPFGTHGPTQNGNGNFNKAVGPKEKAEQKGKEREKGEAVEEDAGELLLDFLNSVRRQHHSPPKQSQQHGQQDETAQQQQQQGGARKRARVDPL